MDLPSITLPPIFIITNKLLQLQTSLLLFYLLPLRWIHLHQMTDKEIIPLVFAKIFSHGMMCSGNHDQFKIFIRLYQCIDHLHGRGRIYIIPPTSKDGSTDGHFPHSILLYIDLLPDSPTKVHSTKSYPYGYHDNHKPNKPLYRNQDKAKQHS